MRLSEWRTRAPHKDAMTPKVLAIVESVTWSLGAETDPTCWIVWGDDPGVRYVILVPTDAGLVQVLVRVNVPQEGPRASAKVIRWNRVQVGELALEMAGGHRLLGFQVESHVLRGADDEGDVMASFALELLARIDGRPYTPRAVKAARSAPAGVGKTAAGRAGEMRSAAGRPVDGKGAATKPAVGKAKPSAGRSSS